MLRPPLWPLLVSFAALRLKDKIGPRQLFFPGQKNNRSAPECSSCASSKPKSSSVYTRLKFRQFLLRLATFQGDQDSLEITTTTRAFGTAEPLARPPPVPSVAARSTAESPGPRPRSGLTSVPTPPRHSYALLERHNFDLRPVFPMLKS